MLLSPARQPETILDWGVYLGYPACCIAHFCRHVASCQAVGELRRIYPADTGAEPWAGTGFIPCPDCRQLCFEDWEKFKQDIAMLRQSGISPFPDFHDHHVRR